MKLAAAGHPPVVVAHSLHHKKPGRSSHSYHHNLHQHQHHHHPHSRSSILHPDLLGAPRTPSKVKAAPRDDKTDMAASFLQFCAMCEKQIAVPSNTVLYCSESCRRKDSCKPLSASLPGSTLSSAAPSPPTSTPSSPRFILKPLTPTAAPISVSLGRIPTDAHAYKSDLDPTEWKPKIPHGSRLSGSSGGGQAVQSEAFRYLSQFHAAAPGTTMATENGYFGFDRDANPNEENSTLRRRSYISRASTTSLSTVSVSDTPGLSTSPTTVSSSYSSMPTTAGYDFDPIPHRPLPPRQKSFYAGGSFGSGLGLDLVTPHCVLPATATANGNGVGGGAMQQQQQQAKIDEGIDCSGIFWEKRVVQTSGKEKAANGGEGLGKLLREAE